MKIPWLEVILIFIGVYALLSQKGWININLAKNWPWIIIIIGVLIFLERLIKNLMGKRKDSLKAFIISIESFLILLGLILLGITYEYIKIDWSKVWPWVLIFLGLVSILFRIIYRLKRE